MFMLLMRVRMLSALNTIKSSFRDKPLFSVFLVLMGLSITAGIFVLFFGVMQTARAINLLDATVRQTLQYLFLFLIGGAVPFVAGTLIQSRDTILLLTSPAPVRTITAAKLIDATIANSLQFSALGIPALVAAGAACRFGLLQWLLMPVLVAAFTALPALITALALMVLLRIFGPRRISLVVNLLNLLTGLLVTFAVLSRLSPSTSRTADINLIAAEQIRTLVGGQTPHVSYFFPVSEAFVASAHGSTSNFLTYTLLAACGAGLLFCLCVLMGERAIPDAAAAEFGGQRETEHSTAADLGGKPLWLPVSAPVRAVIQKDLAMVKRDSVLISQTAMPAILYAVPFVLVASDRSMHDLLAPLCFAIIGIILFMQTSILSMSSIGLEGQAFWACKASPVSATAIVRAKWIWSTLISAAISGILALFTAAAAGLPLLQTVIAACVVLVVSASLCGIGTGISASFPKFVYDNPALRVSAWALILGFIGSSAYLAVIGTVVGLAYWGITFLPAPMLGTSISMAALSIYAAAVALVAAISALSIILPLSAGAARLENSAWEH
jgi:Putative ATP-binding cassette